MPRLRRDGLGGRRILAEYLVPDAICVPIGNFTIAPELRALASEIAKRVGVIIVTAQPDAAREFVEAQARPDHFGIVAGYSDTPWIRDNAPVAVRGPDGLEQILPARPKSERAHDPILFSTIFPGASRRTPHLMDGGNIVSGDAGRAISTTLALLRNAAEAAEALAATAEMLGIEDWLFVPPFADDISAHSDCMVRFLSDDLLALAMRQDCGREVSAQVAAAVSSAWPDIRILELPCQAQSDRFDSPLNWIQLGDLLIEPTFGAADPHADARASLLEQAGFGLVRLPCGTAGLGGGHHCLTASIYAE